MSDSSQKQMTYLKRATEENIIRVWARKTARDDAVPLPTCGQRGGRTGSKYTRLCLLLPSDLLLMLSISFPHSSVGKESACNARDPVWSLGWEDSLEKRKATPIFWPGEFHGLYRPCGCKESDMTEQPSLTSLTHSISWAQPEGNETWRSNP